MKVTIRKGNQFQSPNPAWPEPNRLGVEKSEIRISKSETNSNLRNSKSQTFLFGTFEIWSFEIVSNFGFRASNLDPVDTE